MADRFCWLGQVDHAGKHALFNAIDIFVIPATHPEAKGLPVIEAMAAGVPVVVPDEGAFPELLDGERAGLLHVPRSPADLAATVAELAADNQRAAAIGRYGHELVRTRYEAGMMASAHAGLYERLVAGE